MNRYEIVNIVATGSLDRSLKLEEIAEKLKNSEYDSLSFPGLVLKIENPKTVFLLFASGKVVCTGLKNIADIDVAFQKLDKLIEEVSKE